MIKIQGEAPAPLRQCAQGNGVVRHFSHRNFSLNHLLPLLFRGRHTEYAAACLADTAHDIAKLRIRNPNAKLSVRLQNHGTCLGKPFLIGKLCGKLEGDFIGIHGVIGAVVKIGFEVNHGIASKSPFSTAG